MNHQLTGFIYWRSDFAIWVLESLFEYLYLIEWRGLAQNLEHDLSVRAYDHAQLLDLSWYEKQTIGNITSILNDDVNQLERFLNNGVNQIIQTTSTILIGIIFSHFSVNCIYSNRSGSIIFYRSFFSEEIIPRYKTIREKVGALNTTIVNNLMGIQIIKSLMTFHLKSNPLPK